MKRLDGKLALVTGASSGIGLCFCRRLAERGCNLVMVSNQDAELKQYAAEIAASGVKTYPLYADLTRQEDIDNLLATLDAGNLEVDYLINNAGIFSFSPVVETPQAKIECFIKLHIEAVTNLSRAFALRFKERGAGRILNMSSMSCWAPMPGLAMYSATKAYIRVFSRALYYEMKDYGVTVTVACPGGISTDLFGLPPSLKKLALRLGAITTPERFTQKAIDKMLKGRKQYINGLVNRLAIVFVASMPTCVRMLIKHLMLDKGIRR